jgi:hypothetical protein
VGIEATQVAWPDWLGRLWIPVGIAAAVITVAAVLVVMASRSAWHLLGAGRGLLPEEYYWLWGLVIMLGTTFGQAAGWAGGSAIAYYVMTLVGFQSTWTTARIAMSLVYVGLAAVPLSAYHAYDRWLLGIPRLGLEEWIAANVPDSRWFLLTTHEVVDYSLIPLGVVFLGLLWGLGERAKRDLTLQTVLAVVLLGTSLAVALSLGIHSILVHIRL